MRFVQLFPAMGGGWGSACKPHIPFSLSAPSAYQVVQRDESDTGDIFIAGTFVGGGTHDVEARFNGGAWATIAADATGNFSGTLTNQAAGQGALEVRLVDDITRAYSVPYVGIGDVFVIAGQSNAVGISSVDPALIATQRSRPDYSAMTTLGVELIDPVDSMVAQVDAVSADEMATSGTYWPLLANQIMADTGLPVAFVPCPLAGTAILSWLPGANH